MSQSSPQRGPGRPKDPDKCRAILEAARTQFFERGLEAVSIEGVAAAAGVSRMTVYGHFGNKEGLFTEVIAAEGERVAQALSSICAPGCGLRADLGAFGVDLLCFLQRPKTKAFNRLLEAEAPRHEGLARAFVQAGPRAVKGRLRERLAAAAAAGEIAVADPGRAAGHLMALWRGIETAATHLGLAPPPNRAEVVAHVEDCVALFLRAYAPPGGGMAAPPRWGDPSAA